MAVKDPPLCEFRLKAVQISQNIYLLDIFLFSIIPNNFTFDFSFIANIFTFKEVEVQQFPHIRVI